MPRVARKKSSECTYHVMSRSISEVDLFQCDEDKEYYQSLLVKYKQKYKCSIYAFCLMDNHVHLFINPQGFDISRFMHCLNNAYVSYFNRKYKRHGHLFQGRFASTIVDSDSYALALSAYIHNNPKDMEEYNGREHLYPYSSYGIYLGIKQDIDHLIDREFVLAQFSAQPEKAVSLYQQFAMEMRDKDIWNKIDEDIVTAYVKNEYRSEKKSIARNLEPELLVQRVLNVLDNETVSLLKNKYSKKSSSIRAFVTYTMRVLCGYTYRQICEYIGNMSMSGITKLSVKGFYLATQDEQYTKAFEAILQIA